MRTQQDTTQEIRDYSLILEDLKNVLNSNTRKNKPYRVLSLIKELKQNQEHHNIKGFMISKQFLKGLYENTTKQKARDNLNYILKKLNAIVTQKQQHFKEIEFKKYKTNKSLFSNVNNKLNKNVIAFRQYKPFSVGKIYTKNKIKTFKFLNFEHI